MAISDINQLDLNKTYSYADYLLWQFEERLELIKGKIFNMSPAPSRKHQGISATLHLIMGNAFKNHKCKLYYAPFDVRLPIKDPKPTDKKYLMLCSPIFV